MAIKTINGVKSYLKKSIERVNRCIYDLRHQKKLDNDDKKLLERYEVILSVYQSLLLNIG